MNAIAPAVIYTDMVAKMPEEQVRYMTDKIQAYFDSHDVGREVVLVEEKERLGTGGAVKNVEKEMHDLTQTVFYLSIVLTLRGCICRGR